MYLGCNGLRGYLTRARRARFLRKPRRAGEGGGDLRRNGGFDGFRVQWNQAVANPFSQTEASAGRRVGFAKPPIAGKWLDFLLLTGAARAVLGGFDAPDWVGLRNSFGD